MTESTILSCELKLHCNNSLSKYGGSQLSLGSVNYSPHSALVKKIYQQSLWSGKHIVPWHIL